MTELTWIEDWEEVEWWSVFEVTKLDINSSNTEA
jgi:hypothetical protein